ncbi:MAG: GPP34 family phosphoprotein [Idiomarina sp.]|nr:GPP34 family phosphoprotein [Idiomarina sp.]
MNSLRLYEELMLLALCEERGTMQAGYVNYAVSAAIIAELLLEERISIDDSRRKLINLERNSLSDDPIINEALMLLQQAKRRRSLQSWVYKFSSIKDLPHKVAEQLVKHQIVSGEKETILFLFTRRIYPEINPVPESELRERLRQAVLSHEAEVSPRTAVLVSLMQGARLLGQVFSRQELKEHKKRIEQITQGDVIGKTTKELIAACEAAMMVAVMMPAITVATSS